MDHQGNAMSVGSRMSALVAAAVVAVAVIGCGESNAPKAPPGVNQSAFERQLAEAQRVSAADFPATDDKTLQQVADLAKPGHQIALAASVFVPGDNRLAFGVLDAANRFVYGKTAVYVGRSGQSKAQGP